MPRGERPRHISRICRNMASQNAWQSTRPYLGGGRVATNCLTSIRAVRSTKPIAMQTSSDQVSELASVSASLAPSAKAPWKECSVTSYCKPNSKTGKSQRHGNYKLCSRTDERS